jgi:hypothetical protein
LGDKTTGNAGDIMIQASNLELRDGGVITSRSTSTPTTGPEAGGNINLIADRVTFSGDSLISAESTRSRKAGNISILARDTFQSDNSSVTTATLRDGAGGDITIASGQVQLSYGAVISAKSSGKGDAGRVRITATDRFLSGNSTVTTEAEQADGGNIELMAGSLLVLLSSQVTATVRSGVGKGGNITIDPRFVILDGSQIRADAFGGPGGNVRLVADVFLPSPDSVVSASSTLGIQGTVDIRAPVTSLSGAVAPLTQTFMNVARLLPMRCAARLGGDNVSSLVVGGREGLPLDPSAPLPSPLVLNTRLAADAAMTGELPWQPSTNRFALLTTDDKILPRMGLLHANSLYQTASDPGCSKLLGEKKADLKTSKSNGLD